MCGSKDTATVSTSARLKNLLTKNNQIAQWESLSQSCQKCMESMINDLVMEQGTKDKDIELYKTGGYSVVKLLPELSTYRRIEQHFLKTCATNKTIVLRIDRNVNPQLEKAYQNLKNNNPNAKTIYLFHGTKHINYTKILAEGFKMEYANNGCSGVGIYAAINSSYSISGYAETVALENHETNHHGRMFYCRCLVTDMCAKTESYYCFYNDRQIIPEYIIYYKYENLAGNELIK
jgi:hypothetical protein